MAFDIDKLIELASKSGTHDAINQGAVTLGHLRDVLQMADPKTSVTIDGQSPSGLSSYRGYYERLAFQVGESHGATCLVGGGEPFADDYFPGGRYEPGADGVEIKSPATAEAVIEALNLADGVKFEGYKGGQYLMHPGTLLHVAPYGTTGLLVVGVKRVGDRIELETAEEQW